MTHKMKIALGAGALLAMSSAAALAESSGFAPIETSANLHLAQSGQRAGSSY